MRKANRTIVPTEIFTSLLISLTAHTPRQGSISRKPPVLGPPSQPPKSTGFLFFTASTSLKHLNEVLNLLLLRAARGKVAPPAQVGPARGAGAWLGSARGTSPAFQATGRWRARAGAPRNTECMGIYGGVKCPSAAPARPPRCLRYRI